MTPPAPAFRGAVTVAHLTTVDMSLKLLLEAQLQAARENGFRVVGVSAPGPWAEELEADGYEHRSLFSSTRGWNPAADLRSMRELWNVLKDLQPTVLHTHNPKPGLYGRLLGRLAGVPIVVNTVHGLYATPDNSLPKRAFVYILEAVAARFSDAELVQSREDLELMRRLHMAPRGHLHFLGNGVDLTHFDLARVDPARLEDLSRELGIDAGLPVIGMVGRLVEEKGWIELFAAVETLRSLGLEFEVLAVGPADDDKADAVPPDELARARALGVRFLGLRRDMREIYALLDIFVLPSHREGFPRAAMEAAAMGTPIVATDIRGCREVVDHGVNGLLVSVQSPGELAGAVQSLIEDPHRRVAMGEASRLIAGERFDAARVARTVLDTYQLVAAAKNIDLRAEAGTPVVATGRDAREIARIHAESLPTAFLPTLGQRFLTQLYRSLVTDPQALVLVDRGQAGSVGGFVTGTRNLGASYRRALLRRGFLLAVAALPAVLRHPGVIRRAWETLRYGGSTKSPDLPAAELLAIGVASGHRSAGIGARLTKSFLDRLGEQAVRVVVAGRNEGALRFYRQHGFEPVTTVEVHDGEMSEVLVWRSPSP